MFARSKKVKGLDLRLTSFSICKKVSVETPVSRFIGIL